MSERFVEKTAKTVQDAIALALVELNLELDDAKIEVLDEGKPSIFGLLGSKMAKVRVTALNDDEADATAEFGSEEESGSQAGAWGGFEGGDDNGEGYDEVYDNNTGEDRRSSEGGAARSYSDAGAGAGMGEKTRRAAVTPEDDKERIREFLEGVFGGIHVRTNIEIDDKEDGFSVNVNSEDSGILIGHRGETLEAVQYLTNLCLNRGKEEFLRVTVDIEGYRKKREETLIRLAGKVSEKAVKMRRSITLEPMNSYERRIIHSTLQDNPRVETYSVGEDPNRKVVVTLKNSGGGQSYGGGYRYRR